MVVGLVDVGDLGAGAGGVVSGTIECSGAAVVVGAGNGAAGRVLRCSSPSVPTQAAPGHGS